MTSKTYTSLNERGFAIHSGYMTVYRAKEVTGEYIGECEAYLVSGTGCAANDYADKPTVNAAPGFCIVRSGQRDSWELVEDHRETVCHDKTTGNQVKITTLGPLPANLTEKVPSSPYDRWDGENWVFDADAEAAAHIAAATAQHAVQLAEANRHIVILADAVELGMATEDEQTAYAAWRKYRVELSRMDLSAQPLAWPEKPQ